MIQKKMSFDWHRLVWDFEFSAENSKGMVAQITKNLNMNSKYHFKI